MKKITPQASQDKVTIIIDEDDMMQIVEYKGERANIAQYLLNEGATDDALTKILKTTGKIPDKETALNALYEYYQNNE